MTRRFGDTEVRRHCFPTVSPIPRFSGSLHFKREGFTLLEILVALALLGIAITVILQLFSANLRALSVSGDYVSAALRAEVKMRDILEDTDLTEKSWSEVTDEGYRFDASVTEMLKERTDNLPDDPTSATDATINKEEIITEIDANEGKLDAQENMLKRILGLSQENYRIFNPHYDKYTNLIGGTIKTYTNAIDCENDTNPLAEYQINATFDKSHKMSSYKVKKL